MRNRSSLIKQSVWKEKLNALSEQRRTMKEKRLAQKLKEKKTEEVYIKQ